jgi:hypothetical protein
MSIEIQQQPLAPRIAALLAALRMRIRSYVWTQGLATVVVVLGLAFWFSIAFDWLFEPPWQFRAVMLVAVAAALAYVVNRFLIRRAFRPLDDADLAVLLERRFRDYRDSLLTTVELDTRPSHAAGFNSEMLRHTRRQAIEQSEDVRLGDVFRFSPLLRTLGFAAALAVSVLAFAVMAPQAFATWVNRVVLLDKDLLWPRANHVRVQGFPEGRTLKVAKGSDVEITAAADLTNRFTAPDIVQVRYRTTDGPHGRDNMSTVGAAGPRDREQKYSYVFKGVMSSIDFDIYGGDDRDRGYRLEVVDNPTLSQVELACEYPAYTGRLAGTLKASALVQLPQGTKVTLHCEANKDLVEVPITIVHGDKASTLTEVQLPATGDRRHFEVALPELMEDTTLLFDLHDADGIRSRDPVRLVLAARPDDVPVVALRLRGISTAITPQARLPVVGDVRDDYGLAKLWFEYELNKPTAAKKTAADSTNADAKEAPVSSDLVVASSAGAPPADQPAIQPFRTSTLTRDGIPRTELTIEPANDEALDLKRLSAIGELLQRQKIKTPDDLARIPTPDEKSLVANITTQEQIDRALVFAPQIGGKLLVTLKAADNCALPSGANIGQGERYQLDIVAPEQLLSMLEGRELMLRRQFEIIYGEMTDTRDALAHLDFASPDAKISDSDQAGHEPGEKGGNAGAEPGEKSADDNAPPNETPEQRAARLLKHALEQRELRLARALDNGDRSASETLTVADSFDDLREEMTNNRIDTPELQTRLKDQIADPLRRISTQLFPVYRARLVELRRVLDDPAAGPAKLEAAVKQADAILTEMKLVLDKMLELETFNEVVDMLRDIIASQEKLNQETVKRQKDDLKNKLRDLQE